MAKFFGRLWFVIGLGLRPVPKWNDTLQQIAGILVLAFPPVGAALAKKWGEQHVSVGMGLLVSFGILMCLGFMAAYRIQKQLDETRDGAPKLVCKGVSYHGNPIVARSVEMSGSPLVPTVREMVVGTPIFYHLKIVNEPTGAIDRKTAEKVAARVQIFHQGGTPAASERLHRWEHSPGPADVRLSKSADQLLPIDLHPSGVEYKLDIAMKYHEDEAFYTPNNETAMGGRLDWREEEFKFPPGIYVAEIHLRGVNVFSNLRCQIVNKGKGSKLEITPLPQ